MLLLQWNIRSLNANKNNLLKLIEELSPSVIALQETWLKQTCRLPGYHIVQENRRGTEKGGGILTAIHKNLAYSSVHLPNRPNTDLEVQKIQIHIQRKIYRVINIYKRPRVLKDEELDFLKQILEPSSIFCGDLNAKIFGKGNKKGNPSGNKLEKWIMDNNTVLLNNDHFTYIGNNTQTSGLDVTIVTPDIAHKMTWETLDLTYGSDHFPITVSTLDGSKVLQAKKKRYVNWQKFATELRQQFKRTEGEEISTEVKQLNKILLTSRELCTNTIKEIYNGRKAEWWNVKCAKQRAKVRKAFKTARRCIAESTWKEYKKQEALFRKTTKEAKCHYWSKRFKEINSPKEYFQIFKNFKAWRCQQPDDTHMIMKFNNSEIVDPKAQAELFLNHFTKMRRLETPQHLEADEDGACNNVTENEFTSAVKRLKEKTPGKDKIDCKIIKQCPCEVKQYIRSLINKSFKEGFVPVEWKSTTIVPIYKQGKNKTEVSSYRPIALTSHLGKVAERIMLERLEWWAEKEHIFPENIYGFRPKKDAEQCLFDICQDIRHKRGDKKNIVLVSLDIKSAYDNVNIGKLLGKLVQKSCPGYVAIWIKQLLTNREINVKWRGVETESKNASMGLPQGSVLSPFLFNVYVSDICEIADRNTRLFVYADDVTIIISGEHEDRVMQKVTEVLKSVETWGEKWNMDFSPEKSKIVNLTQKREKAKHVAYLGGRRIAWAGKTKILGLTITENWKWEDHQKEIFRKVQKTIDTLKMLAGQKNGLSTETLLHIVVQVALAQIDYASTSRFEETAHLQKKYKIIENAALRLALGVPRWTVVDALRRESNMPEYVIRKEAKLKKFLLRQEIIRSHQGYVKEIGTQISKSKKRALNWSQQIVNRLEVAMTVKHLKGCNISMHNSVQPWIIGEVNVQLDELPFQKARKEEAPILFEYFKANAGDNVQWIGIDGSKTQNGTGFGIFKSDVEYRSIRIPKLCSIFTAELAALLYAICFLTCKDAETIIISDSRAVLEALNNANRKSEPLIQYIRNHILGMQKAKIHLIWVPGHAGISLNEKADKLAKKAANDNTCPMWGICTAADIKKMVKSEETHSLNAQWQNSKHKLKFPYLNPPDIQAYKLVKERNAATLIEKLRTSSLLTRYLKSKWDSTIDGNCPHCKVKGDLEHALLKCKLNLKERTRYFAELKLKPGITPTVQDCLSFSQSSDPARAARALISFARSFPRF